MEVSSAVDVLARDQKIILTEELLDDLNAPNLSGDQEMAILDVLNGRFEAICEGHASASSWDEVRSRLREKTGSSWRN